MKYKYNDGGRAKAGYKGTSGDCVVRSIAIVSGVPYQDIYDKINILAKDERITKRRKKQSNSANGVYKITAAKLLKSLGFTWVPTMFIGSGCNVHLRAGEVPMKGNIIVRLSGHFCAVIDGVIHDTFDCSRGGTRCVYGYFIKQSK
jgi:hypothetical protein